MRSPAQFIGELPETTPYDVPPGTWLEKAGYCGQEMHWSVFEYKGDVDDVDASVDLSGLGGEKREFEAVRWTTFDELVPTMVGFKRPVYERLASLVEPVIAGRAAGRDGTV